MSFNLPILLDVRAEEDIDTAAQWYANERSDLALAFLSAVDDVFERIAQFPQAYPEVEAGTRKALMKRFPFCVYYTIDIDSITIVAVLHLRQSPGSWRSRFD